MSGAGRRGSGERRFPSTGASNSKDYFDYQHDTGGDPNRQVHAIGTVLNLYSESTARVDRGPAGEIGLHDV